MAAFWHTQTVITDTDQLIGGLVQVHPQPILVKVPRHVSELHADFCSLGVQGFACLQQKRDAVPSSIVDEAGHSSKGGAQTASPHHAGPGPELCFKLW